MDDKDRLPLIGGSGETGRGILGVIVFFFGVIKWFAKGLGKREK